MSLNLSEQNIVNNNSAGEKLIREGAAEIKIPEGAKIFYNPVQEFNRDLRYFDHFVVIRFRRKLSVPLVLQYCKLTQHGITMGNKIVRQRRNLVYWKPCRPRDLEA